MHEAPPPRPHDKDKAAGLPEALPEAQQLLLHDGEWQQSLWSASGVESHQGRLGNAAAVAAEIVVAAAGAPGSHWQRLTSISLPVPSSGSLTANGCKQ